MRISGKELISVLKKLDFEVIRTCGSHNFLKKERLTTIVPVHNNRDLGKGLVLSILDDLKIDRKKFKKYIETKNIKYLK